MFSLKLYSLPKLVFWSTLLNNSSIFLSYILSFSLTTILVLPSTLSEYIALNPYFSDFSITSFINFLDIAVADAEASGQ